MIITHLQSGLGNQMFQYAAGLALAEHRRTILKLDASWYHYDPHQELHNKYSLNCFNITEQFATENEVQRLKGRPLTRSERLLKAGAKLLKLNAVTDFYSQHGVVHTVYDDGFHPRFFELPDNTYLRGLWQSERYFQSAEALVRFHFSFRYPLQPAAAELADIIRTSENSVAVHFRRGDYVKTAQYFEEIKQLPPEEFEAKKKNWLEKVGANLPLPLDYYYRAIEYLRNQVGDLSLFIFSDDIQNVEEEFQPPGRHLFVKVGLVPHDTLRLMSLCEHAIIANSSFSWWAAWLNPSESKTVVAPAPWFPNNAQLDQDVIPQSWIRLPACAMAELPN